MECPECNSSLYSKSFDSWTCSKCAYKEDRVDTYAMSVNIYATKFDDSIHIPIPERQPGNLKRLFEIRKNDRKAVLDYLKLMRFEGDEALNRNYLAANLSIELGEEAEAKKYLQSCLEMKTKSKQPNLIDDLLHFHKSLHQN